MSSFIPFGKFTCYQRRNQNLPCELIRYILEFLNDLDANREFNIYNKINISKYESIINPIIYTSCISSYASPSYTWGTMRNNVVIHILETHRYYTHNLIEKDDRINENEQDLVQIIYGKTPNNRYMKEIQIRKMKSNSINLTTEEFQEKVNKEQRQMIFSNPLDTPYYWDNITSCFFNKEEIM